MNRRLLNDEKGVTQRLESGVDETMLRRSTRIYVCLIMFCARLFLRGWSRAALGLAVAPAFP